MTIHRSAAVGFGASADAYERGRPAYSLEAVERLAKELLILPGTHVLDLAAGTGKLTRPLVAIGAEVVAVEPVAAMRAKLADVPGVEILDGTAEAIPLPDGSVDVVTVGQAFHWFDGERALAEIHRVLGPHGGLGLIWQARDPIRPWIKRLDEIIDRADDGHPRFRTFEWRGAFERSDRFGPLESADYTTVQRADVETLIDRVASISYIAALPDEARAAVLAEVRELLTTDVELAGADAIELPYRVHVYWTFALRTEHLLRA